MLARLRARGLGVGDDSSRVNDLEVWRAFLFGSMAAKGGGEECGSVVGEKVAVKCQE